MLLAGERHGEQVGTAVLKNMKCGPVLISTISDKNTCPSGYEEWEKEQPVWPNFPTMKHEATGEKQIIKWQKKLYVLLFTVPS